jgi:hypothetical protein
MDQKIYHGDIEPRLVAEALTAAFNRGNLRVITLGDDKAMSVQIASANQPAAGGQTALGVNLQKVPDGLLVQVGQQTIYGVAASLGLSALAALANPFNLVGRLDDIAQDIESLTLSEDVWKTIDGAARSAGSGFDLSDRLRRMVCAYCNTANPVDAPSCIACGAPLGGAQPKTCKQCGYVLKPEEHYCPNCGALV